MSHSDSQNAAIPRIYSSKTGSPSFRKRRPFLFVLLLVFLCLLALWLISAFLSYADRKGLFSGSRLGVLRVEGAIVDARKAVGWAARLRDDDSVAGVLLRIDSPGGGVAPSQEIYAAVKRLAAKKPVVVSMGTAGASGGYYIALAGHEIFANPSTITGSIGVRLQLVNVEGFMDRIGLRSESFTTGALKDTGSPFHTMSETEKAYLQGLIEDMQEEFVRVVAESRHMQAEDVRRLADGRAYTGRQALGKGLVDALGDEESALERLAALTHLPLGQTVLVEEPKPSRPLWRELLGIFFDIEDIRAATVPAYKFYY